MINDWFPLTYVLNNLNRGLGLPDSYPFVLSTPVLEKLRFVHETVKRAVNRPNRGTLSWHRRLGVCPIGIETERTDTLGRE